MKNIFALIVLCGFMSCSSTSKKKNMYVIETEIGDITFEVYPDKAPITVANFKKYVQQAKFEDAYFYRVVRLDNQPINPVKIEVIQGDFTGKKNYFPVIAHETTEKTGLSHKNGTVSMGRFDVGSTAAEFFICINDQPELDFKGKRNPDGQGFAAFGQVKRGMSVVLKIQSGETNEQTLKEKIRIKRIYPLK